MKINIIYEDNHIIAVFKPAGVLAQGDRTGDSSIYELVKDYIRIRKGKTPLGPVRNSEGSPHTSSLRGRQRKISNGVFLGLLHRLDRPVSGIMLFAKTSKGASRLSEQFRNREVEKMYHAIVIGKPGHDKGVLLDNLKKIKTQNAKFKTTTQNSNQNKSLLYYEVVKSNDKYSLLKIKIETGKFHQIRAQVSMAGFPILGDVKYGGRQWEDAGSIALCATDISFKSATGNKKVTVSIEIPREWEMYIKG
jgi:23S rRNA pseudouridine1911/1915/1917 synthase